MTRLTCDNVRSYAFLIRHERLDPVVASEVAEHCSGCVECSAYVGRLDDVLSVAAEMPASVVPKVDADALFGRIMGAIEGGSAEYTPDASAGSSVSPNGDTELDDGGVSERSDTVAATLPAGTSSRTDGDGGAGDRGRGVRFGGLMLAAAMLVALFAGLFASGILERAPGEAAVLQPLAGLAWESPAAEESATIVPAEGAVWERVTGGVRLESGSLVIEYLGVDGRSFVVTTPHREIAVTGTVLFVSVGEATEAGVVVGSIEVRDSDDRQRTLRDGQMIGGHGVVDVPAETAGVIAAVVDVAGHNARLERRREEARTRAEAEARAAEAARLAAERRAAAPARVSEREEVRTSRRERGYAAMRAGEYREAATLLERALRSGEGGASLRLDLARIYLRHLGRTEAAVRHLEAFVRSAPNDPASGAVRAQLCGLEAGRARAPDLCD